MKKIKMPAAQDQKKKNERQTLKLFLIINEDKKYLRKKSKNKGTWKRTEKSQEDEAGRGQNPWERREYRARPRRPLPHWVSVPAWGGRGGRGSALSRLTWAQGPPVRWQDWPFSQRSEKEDEGTVLDFKKLRRNNTCNVRCLDPGFKKCKTVWDTWGNLNGSSSEDKESLLTS